ncbi:MAG: hypothetical protein LAO79_10120 [Acidobacteriia bacterium]|nr:hypothetical protein [Terriglobia bacterium]
MVVYLRTLNEPVRASLGLPASELFPLMHVGGLGPLLSILKIELGREAATMVMLATVAAAAGTRWLPAFALLFGVWDLVFYAALKILIGWPVSLWTWDLLFLIPVPWTGPVLAPSIVAASLVAGGLIGLMRPVRQSRTALALIVVGAAVIIVSFTWDWRWIFAGGVPRVFPWWIFWSGEFLGIAGVSLSLMGKTEG